MSEIPTFEEIYDRGKAEARARRPALTDWSEGSHLDALTGSAAMVADQRIRADVDRFAAQFLDTAEGEDLDALVLDRFLLVRIGAVAATVTLTFTRGSSVGDLPVLAGRQVQATVDGDQVTFVTDATATMLAAESTLSVVATASITGRAGNVAAGTLTQLLNGVSGDPDITVTNTERAAGGADAETDDQLRERARGFFQTVQRGTVAALIFGARLVPGVVSVTVDESTALCELGGYVSVYVGDPDGTGNAALAAAVALELDNWRAASVEVRVLPSQREFVAVALRVRVRSLSNTPALEAAIRAAVTEYTSNLRAGETLYDSRIESAALSASLGEIVDVDRIPAGDTEASEPFYAIRVRASDLTIAFVLEGS